MSERFRVGDHVTWNSEAGHVSGHIITVHTSDFDYKGLFPDKGVAHVARRAGASVAG